MQLQLRFSQSWGISGEDGLMYSVLGQGEAPPPACTGAGRMCCVCMLHYIPPACLVHERACVVRLRSTVHSTMPRCMHACPPHRSQDLSNTIWALAVLKYQPSQEWWSGFERQMYSKLTDFSDRDLANLMWSLAMLDHKPTWVLGPLLESAADNFSAFSPNALHLVGWACGKLGFWCVPSCVCTTAFCAPGND